MRLRVKATGERRKGGSPKGDEVRREVARRQPHDPRTWRRLPQPGPARTATALAGRTPHGRRAGCEEFVAQHRRRADRAA